jgi:hypothetical protein
MRIYRPPKDLGDCTNKITFLPDLNSGEKGMAAELCERPHMQVHEIGVSPGEKRIAAELYGSSETQVYEIGLSL